MRLLSPSRRAQAGSALVTVMVLTGASLLLLSAALDWTSSSAIQMQRNNEYYRNGAAAAAAAEKVVAAICRDYQSSDESQVYSRLATYRRMVPTPQEDADWSPFEFSDAQGNRAATYVERLAPWQWGPLSGGYAGLRGYAAPYRVISNARLLDPAYSNVVSAVKREVQLASVPVFEFGFFYAIDLEFDPSDNWTVTGPVHANGNVYIQPDKTATFQGRVTSAQRIIHDHSPLDPVSRTFGSVVYQAGRNERMKSLNLPLGTNNSPENWRALVEIPPPAETVDSLLGKQRYYNKADLIILVSNNVVVTTSGAYNNFRVTIPWTQVRTFVDTNAVFFNKRENKSIQATQIRVDAFNASYATWTALLGRAARTLYVADLRTQTAATQSGVRLVNGKLLPIAGLTVATPNPLYVKGDYNAPTMVVKIGL